jgi:hypothetical protein
MFISYKVLIKAVDALKILYNEHASIHLKTVKLWF